MICYTMSPKYICCHNVLFEPIILPFWNWVINQSTNTGGTCKLCENGAISWPHTWESSTTGNSAKHRVTILLLHNVIVFQTDCTI